MAISKSGDFLNSATILQKSRKIRVFNTPIETRVSQTARSSPSDFSRVGHPVEPVIASSVAKRSIHFALRVESVENLKPIGVITDRDIAWRVVTTGKSPAETSVRDAMLGFL